MLVRSPQRPRNPRDPRVERVERVERGVGARRLAGDTPPVLMLTRGCDRARGSHIDYAHSGRVDRCLCGWDERPCHGDCGLPDCSWLTVRTEVRV